MLLNQPFPDFSQRSLVPEFEKSAADNHLIPVKKDFFP